MHLIKTLFKRRRFIARPIREIIAAATLLLLLFVALDSWRIWKDRNREIRDASVNLENMVRMIAEQTESTFEIADMLLVANVRHLESSTPDANTRRHMHDVLVAVREKSSRIHVISVLDERGNWLINANRTQADPGKNFADRDYFRYHRNQASNKLFIGIPIKDKTTGKWTITLTRRWNKPDGSFGGVVLAGIALDYFQAFFQTLDIGSNGAVALHRDDAIVLARRPYLEDNLGKSVAKGEMFSRYLPQSAHGTYRNRALLDQQDRLASYRHLNKYPVVASAALSMDEVLASWQTETWQHLVVMSIIIGICFALAFRLGRQIKQRALAERALSQSTATIQTAVANQKQTEQRLRENEHFLASLLDFIPGMVAYWNADLVCRFANKSYQEWFGKSKEEMLGLRIQDLLGETLLQKNIPYIEGALSGQAQHFERTLTKPSGDIGYTWAHYLPDIENGQVMGFFVLVSDVTELKLGQIKLERLNEELNLRTRQAEAASIAKSQFLANMSHEIRTPMNAVLGMVQLLEQTDLTTRQHDYVVKAQSATHSLLAIINDILDFSKVEAGKLTLEVNTFSLDTPLSELSVILSASVGNKDIEVLFDVDPRIPQHIVGDALRLQQVLLNLAGNAVKFTEQGEVLISAVLKLATTDEIEVEFSVRDTGIGIGAEQLQLIFTGFSQAEASTTRRFGGTGLGLAISRRLVELMGGRLQVESESGKGSRFFFSLQFKTTAAPADAPPPDSQQPPHQIAAQRRLHILLVDDKQVVRNCLSAMLAAFGWSVAEAADGAQALEMLEMAYAAGTPFDVLLLDSQMPVMDGWETALSVRRRPFGAAITIILMLTTYYRAQLNERMHAETAVIDRFLFKPATASMLLDAVAGSGDMHREVSDSDQPRPHVVSQHLTGLHLLVVEDNLLNQQVAMGMLSSEGAEVVVASSGQQGIDLLLSAHSAFDLVLMDIQMPGMDGYTTTKAIRQLPGMQTLPILAMTANAMPADKQASAAAGMNDHICKPINLAELVRVICQYVTPRHVTPQQPGAADAERILPAATIAFALQHQIDLQDALARFGGHLPVYCSVLRVFENDAQQMAGQICTLLAQQDTPALKRLLHTLKSTAAAVGAQALAAAAKDAEARLNSGVAPDTLSTQLGDLSQALEVKSEMIKQLLARLTQSVAQHDTTVDSVDREKLLADMKSLLTLMQASNLNALSCFAALQAPLSALAADISVELEGAIERLDFAAAIPCCESLIRQWESETINDETE